MRCPEAQGLAITGVKNLDQDNGRGHGEDREQPWLLLQGICVCTCVQVCVHVGAHVRIRPFRSRGTHLHGPLFVGPVGLQGLRGEVGLPGIKGKLEGGAGRKRDVTL